MTRPVTQPAAGPADEQAVRVRVRESLAAERDSLLERRQALDERLDKVLATLRTLTAEDDAELIRGRDPRDFWTDDKLRAQVVEREWADGRGSQLLNDYISAAFTALAPAGFYSFARTTETTSQTRQASQTSEPEDWSGPAVRPILALTRGQDVTAVADALVVAKSALVPGDGPMTVEVLEHTCAEDGPVTVEVEAPDCDGTTHATLRCGWATFSRGPLTGVLEKVAADFWC